MTRLPGTIPDAKNRSQSIKSRAGGSRASNSGSSYEDLEDAPPKFLEICWPLLPAIALGIFSPRIYAALTMHEPLIMWFVFPFVVVFGRPEFGFSEELTRTLPQLFIYIQFPLEGLLTVFNLSRRVSFASAMAQLIFLHCVCAFVLWLLSQPAHP
jgi:hypothetical protein